MALNLAYVALGGAVGAVLRYLMGMGITRVAPGGFPLGVITVNILGSLMMGLFVVYAGRKGLAHLTPLFAVGLLGGFTTFSAFSLEAVTLFERGQTGAAAVYVGVSVAGSVLALALGVWIARGIWA